MSRRPRQGFTLVEMLVVIAIIGILAALLLPAVQMAREAARKAECSNKMRQWGLAALNFEQSKGELPGYQQLVAVGNAGLPGENKPGTWVVALLQQTERLDLWERWNDPSVPLNNPVLSPYMDLTICPSAPSKTEETAYNYYVANAGYLPRQIDPAPLNEVSGGSSFPCGYLPPAQRPSNGIFHDKITKFSACNPRPFNPTVTMSDIRDGTVNTIMFSENLQAGPWNQFGPMDITQTTYGAYTVPQNARLYSTFHWFYAREAGSPTEDAHVLTGMALASQSPVPPVMKINGNKTQFPFGQGPPGAEAARPSSFHHGGVNVCYADAHVDFLREEIEYHVYQQLMTPYGTQSDMPHRISYVLRNADY